MKKRFYKKSDPLIAVEEPLLHQKYHVSWGNSHGVVGKVINIDYQNKTVKMISPSSKVVWKYPVRWSELRHLRKTQQRIEHLKNNPNDNTSPLKNVPEGK